MTEVEKQLVSAIIFVCTTLGSAIVAMAIYIVHVHTKHSKTTKELLEAHSLEIKELLVSSLATQVNTASVVENNNLLVSKMLDKLP